MPRRNSLLGVTADRAVFLFPAPVSLPDLENRTLVRTFGEAGAVLASHADAEMAPAAQLK